MELQRREADVLVIGGGIAGCMAAIRARELGLSVILWDKANPRRSGGAATGIDHCWAYLPEIHEKQLTKDEMVEDHLHNAAGGFAKAELVRAIVDDSRARVADLERFGVPMRDDAGNFRLIKKLHRVPSFIHFAGRDIKVILTHEMVRRRVKIFKRVMAIELLKEGNRVVGCVGISTKEPLVYACKAKAVILTTGGTYRLYSNPTQLPFNVSHPPSDTGDGQAMAFRAGARLVNMEFVNFHIGPKNFARAGRGSYVPGGRIVNSFGLPLGQKPGEQAIDRTVENPAAFRREYNEGRGPCYMDLRGATSENIEYIKWALTNEGNTAYLGYLEDQGIDFATQPVEWDVYEPKQSSGLSGLDIGTQAQTSLVGLFAAGDVVGALSRSVCPGALTFGYRAADSAARFISSSPLLDPGEESESKISSVLSSAKYFLTRKYGASWEESLSATQNLMSNYCGLIRSASLLEAGIDHLNHLEEQIREEGQVANPHELYRLFEVLNLLEVGRLIAYAALYRTESRYTPWSPRVDFPQADDENWHKLITLWKEKEKIEFSKLSL